MYQMMLSNVGFVTQNAFFFFAVWWKDNIILNALTQNLLITIFYINHRRPFSEAPNVS